MKKTIMHVINWCGLRGSEKTCLNFARHAPQYNHLFVVRSVNSDEALNEFMAVGDVVIQENRGSGGYFDYVDINGEFINKHSVDLAVVYLPGDELPPYVKELPCPVVLHVLCSKQCLFDKTHLDAVTVPSQYAITLNEHLDPEYAYPTVEKMDPVMTKTEVLKKYFGEDAEESAFLISRIGSIESVKHVEDFLQIAYSFSHVENCYFLVAGMGEEGYIAELSKYWKSSPNIVYAGTVTEQEKSDINAASDVCLYPTEFEAFGYSMAEPMSHGTPVVSYNESACPETIGKGGTLVEFNEMEKLAVALVDLLVRPLQRKKLAEAAYLRWEENFSPGKYTETIVPIYERLLNA